MGKDGMGGTGGPSEVESVVGVLQAQLRDQRMKYLGVLGLLSQCSVHVPDDINESIESAFVDACADGRLQYRRILNRLEIEPRR
jgi:hypothetical protein